MKQAYIFPGQGAQYPGMGASLYAKHKVAKKMLEDANTALGFSITDMMFKGSLTDLQQTHITQPAVFLHAVVSASCLPNNTSSAEAVAGHSLGEFSALVLCGALTFLDGLNLVLCRAKAMQQACEQVPSTMAVVLGLQNTQIEEVCSSITEEVVVPANYNMQGQLVISGTVKGIQQATEKLQQMGAKRVLPLAVGGAFHSPLMQPAQEKLAIAIENTHFRTPSIPIYQNLDSLPSQDTKEIKQKLVKQLTSPVQWYATIENMHKDGFVRFTEYGPGRVLQGLVKKVVPQAQVNGFD